MIHKVLNRKRQLFVIPAKNAIFIDFLTIITKQKNYIILHKCFTTFRLNPEIILRYL